MCIDMCGDLCTDMCVDLCADMCMDVFSVCSVDVYIDMARRVCSASVVVS